MRHSSRARVVADESVTRPAPSRCLLTACPKGGGGGADPSAVCCKQVPPDHGPVASIPPSEMFTPQEQADLVSHINHVLREAPAFGGRVAAIVTSALQWQANSSRRRFLPAVRSTP